MRAQGRCAGCDETGELKKIDYHVMQCTAWAKLYLTSPAAALRPAEEYARWHREERTAEHQAGLAVRIADTQERRAASVSRFEVKDPLGD
jgi:hypothetical protein